jgi:Family of unknown function (DUF5682)
MNVTEVFPPPPIGEAAPLCRVFGVRHLSPAAAFHLHAILDELKPTAVLVEGPADATDQLKHLIHKDTRPPLAILAYTMQRPVRSILYPLASYSPEWVALTWGLRNKAETRCIDLPAAVFLEMHHLPPVDEEINEQTQEDGQQQQPQPEVPSTRRPASEHTLAYLDDPWTAIARLSGDPDHETWWERHFEHTTDPISYAHQIHEFGRGLRGLRELKPEDENLIREAYMRRCIREVLAKGHKPDRVLVVCGAFHSSALRADLPPMSDKELKALPTAKCSLTLMPYSYFRLSSQSGYGAGNHAPGYYQRLYDERQAGRNDRLVPLFLTELVHGLRKAGQIRSAAEVIEAVRLSRSLATLADSPAPCLRDLRDAAICCLGRGEFEVIREPITEIEIGSAVGKLPKGVSRTGIQDDFYLRLEELSLDKYQTEKAQELVLDLREDRFAKKVEMAFRDRNRSTFLHRLEVLGIDFGAKQHSKQDQATWKEIWHLKWKPDSEIQLVENSLLADTVEMAAAVRLSQRLGECTQIDQSATIVKEAVVCELADALEDARRRLQAMAVEANGFVQLAAAVEQLAEVITYGSVRKFDPEPIKPLLSQLFLRGTFAVRDACLCDNATAREQVQPAILKLHDVARTLPELVDTVRWNRELDGVASSDSMNAYLSGFVMSVILNRIDEAQLAREVSRRLSAGVPADIGAAWFEGLVQYNRQALFMRLALWRQLDAYLQSLDEPGFRLAVVPLRRAFSGFDVSEVRRVVSNLVEISQEGAEDLKKSVDVKFSDEEAEKLQQELGDLDLGL